MRLPRFDYVKPASLEEVLALLHESGSKTRILAGGTDLLVNMKYGLLRPEKIVSIRALPDLGRVSEDRDGNVRVGACISLADLAKNRMISEKLPAFREAVAAVASRHIRNMASLGGNICLDTRCWYYNQSKLWREAREACYKTGGSLCHSIKGSKRCHAINSSDTAPMLMALNARVVVMKSGHERVVPLRQFYGGDGLHRNVLEPDEMVTEIVLPAQDPNSRARFIKVCSRRGIDFASGSIAARISWNHKKCTAAKLIIGSMTSAPRVLEKAAQVLMDSGLSEKSIEKAADVARSELGTLTNLFFSAGYKRDLAGVLVRRVLYDIKEKTKDKRRAKR